MPLVTCPDCTTEVSDAAFACPKCGHPMQVPPKPATKSVGSSALVGAGTGFGLGFLMAWSTCRNVDATGILIYGSLAGALFAILGALAGAAVGVARK